MNREGNGTPEASNARDGAPTEPQTYSEIRDIVMDWMEEEQLDFHSAATHLKIPFAVFIGVCNGHRFSPFTRKCLAQYIPGIYT